MLDEEGNPSRLLAPSRSSRSAWTTPVELYDPAPRYPGHSPRRAQGRGKKVFSMAESKTSVRYFGRATGRVQGVGFRMFVQQHASELGLTGWVRNMEDGSVDGDPG